MATSAEESTIDLFIQTAFDRFNDHTTPFPKGW